MTISGTNDVRQIAKGLDLPIHQHTFDGIFEAVREAVYDMIADSPYPKIRKLSQLERVICNARQIKIEFIDNDEDIRRIADERSYVADELETKLRNHFDKRGNAGFTCENNSHGRIGRRWLVVVDRRGSKKNGAEFTKWHEIAHVLTGFFPASNDDIEHQADTETPEKEPDSPGEQLMERIAAELLYWENLWNPQFSDKLRQVDRLTFDIIEDIRSRYQPTASFHSCAIHVVKQFHRPCYLVKADMAHNKTEKRKIVRNENQTTLGPAFAPELPPKKLRLVDCVTPNHIEGPNPLEIWKHVRVPEDSVIAKVFRGEARHATEETNQAKWETSRKGSLSAVPLYVEAKAYGTNIFGLLSIC